LDEEPSVTQPQRVENLSHAQRERLAYIDCRLYFFGEICVFHAQLDSDST
jgi:hypothetical protein